LKILRCRYGADTLVATVRVMAQHRKTLPPIHRDILVDETAAAYLRGVSADTQRRHRLRGIGPKPVVSPNGRPRYRLLDIEAEQDIGAEGQRLIQEVAAASTREAAERAIKVFDDTRMSGAARERLHTQLHDLLAELSE
jgi:hypothetical protein